MSDQSITIEVQQMNAAEAIKMAQKIIDRAQASIDAMRNAGYSQREAEGMARVYWKEPAQLEKYGAPE